MSYDTNARFASAVNDMNIVVQTVGRGRLSLVVAADVSVAALRSSVAAACGLAPERTKLSCGGRVLEDGDGAADLHQGAVVFALAAPLHPLAQTTEDQDEDDDDVIAQLRLRNLKLHPRLRRSAARLVAKGVPEALLSVLLSLRPRTLLLFGLWCAASRAAGALGPLFVLFSLVAVMFCSLGTRRNNELSAYSLFNPGVRAIPGGMDQEELDRALRGH